MKILIFLFNSALEWMSLLLLTFAVFRFPVRGIWGQIVLAAFILALLSHLVFNSLDVRVLAAMLQPPAVFLLLWQMFRIPAFYAAFVTVFGYLGYVVLQFVILYVFVQAGLPLESIGPHKLSGYLLSGLSIAVTLSVSRLLYIRRLGFTFVPDGSRTSVPLRGVNLQLLLLAVIGYIIVACTNYIVFTDGLPLLLVAIVSVFLGVLLHFALKKEFGYD